MLTGSGSDTLRHVQRKVQSGEDPEPCYDKENKFGLHIYMSIQNTAFWMAPIRSKEYVARVKELGMDSAAITDHGVMYGVIDLHHRSCKRSRDQSDPRM